MGCKDFFYDLSMIILTILVILLIGYLVEYFQKPKIEDVSLNDKKKIKNTGKNLVKTTDLNSQGIGGMQHHFDLIHKKVLAIRQLDKKIADNLGVRPVKGIILYGPPGTGKTLMAVTISKMLNCEEPVIVSGPSVLNSYIGETEKNVRNLFKNAISDEKYGFNNLHVIILDEFDSIGGRRSEKGDTYGVRANIVNTFLSMMDGPIALNNILLIGITNRLETIDEALLRPGRFELQLEIGLPTKEQRLEILKVKTKKLSENDYLDPYISLEELADKTEGYSGADIEGLINAVVSELICEKINKNVKNCYVTTEDFTQHIVPKNISVTKKKEDIDKSLLNFLTDSSFLQMS